MIDVDVVSSASPHQLAWQRFRKDRVGMLSGCVVLGFVVIAALAPAIAQAYGKDPYTTYGQDTPGLLNDYGFPVAAHGGMSSHFWLGLEPGLGRDVLTQLLYGARTSLFIALSAALLTTSFGVLYGLVIGYLGGWVDAVGSRLMDVVFAFPGLLFLIAFGPVIESRFVAPEQETPTWLRFASLITVLSVLGWAFQARLIRGQVLSLREREFVDAARLSGASSWRILRKELLPNLWPQVLVVFSLAVPLLITSEAALAFLGVGIVEPVPDWGRMINRGSQVYRTDPTYMVFPGLALFVLVLTFNLLGDAVRDALDPRVNR